MSTPALTPNPEPSLLQMQGITKRFPGVLALSSVDFDVRKGEVHALVGENGAGKSTLMKIIAGVYQRDEGEMFFKGHRASFDTPRQSQLAGIATIYQELNQVPHLSVTENIFLGSEITQMGKISWNLMHQWSRELLAKLHLDIDPRVRLGTLGVAQQQMVEVAKALHRNAELIIMDEPTSSLSIREIYDLFDIIREFKANGVSVIYISHHLEETFELSDRITVLRDGQHVVTQPASEMNLDSLIRFMVGRDLAEKFPKEHIERGDEVLRIEGLYRGDTLRDISFSAYAGEVLGIAGLVGSGRTELVRAIFGADPIDSGKFSVSGKPVRINSPSDAIHHGICLLTEDRKQQGLFLLLTVRENISMVVLDRLLRGLRISRRKERELAEYYVDNFAIRISSLEQLAMNLSGGTQQKVVLSKWLATKPKVLIFDEPTRGIDVGAKVEIYRVINQLAKEGVAILVISSELPEILGISDRILVMGGGQIRGELTRGEASEEKIMELATGTEIDESHLFKL